MPTAHAVIPFLRRLSVRLVGMLRKRGGRLALGQEQPSKEMGAASSLGPVGNEQRERRMRSAGMEGGAARRRSGMSHDGPVCSGSAKSPFDSIASMLPTAESAAADRVVDIFYHDSLLFIIHYSLLLSLLLLLLLLLPLLLLLLLLLSLSLLLLSFLLLRNMPTGGGTPDRGAGLRREAAAVCKKKGSRRDARVGACGSIFNIFGACRRRRPAGEMRS